MAARKIIWSHKANIKLFQILEFYSERNKSTTYSKKIFRKFKKELSLLKTQPELGTRTDDEQIRGLIVDKFILFYEVTTEAIIVHSVWDSRQNPEDLIFGKGK
jgi:plasmid stabilization system protein ParE